MSPRLLLPALALVALLLVLYGSVYVVSQTETALVTQFGNPVTVRTHPGLGVKMPFLQTVEYFDKRLLEYVMPEEIEINAADEKRIRLEAFLRWHIVDPLAFARATRMAGIGGNRIQVMDRQLANLLGSGLRQVIGSVPFGDLLSVRRDAIMQRIRDLVNKQATGAVPSAVPSAADAAGGGFGIVVTDVRIVKADLPPENSNAIFRRMQTEREREAKSYRAKGEEEAQRIRSNAERERTVLIADAQKQAQILRGEGDGDAARILAAAYGKDPEFFAFYRSMQAYAQAFGKDATFVLSPESGFLKEFGGKQ